MFWFSKKKADPQPQPSDELILLKTFADRFEAEIVKGLLESRDIPSFITQEDIGGTQPYFIGLTGGVRLFVRQDYVERALELLAASEEDGTRGDAA